MYFRKDFTDEFGVSDMHIMRECPFGFNVAFGLQKDSKYKARYIYCILYEGISIITNVEFLFIKLNFNEVRSRYQGRLYQVPQIKS